MNYRCVMTSLITCVFVPAVIGLGCGGAQEEALYVRHESAPRTMTEPPPSIEVPVATEQEVKACVDASDYRWAEPSYAFLYDLETSQQGKILNVKLRDSTLRDIPLEECFERALAVMSVPNDALRLRSSTPVSGGESTYSSRSSVGFVQAAAAPIALAPIIIPALGVTIIVAISLDIIRKATSEDAERERCRQVNEACQQKCLPQLKHSDFGNQFHRCMRVCREAAGCWKAT